jgi:undecaprenyl diphosphate synthase
MNPLNHVAIIMDGNGRWGLKKKNNRNYGHQRGIHTLEKIIKFSLKSNIKFLTLYAFSTENWKRPINEINFLINLLELYLKKNLGTFIKNDIKLQILGKKNFSPKLNKLLIDSEKITSKNKSLHLSVALNYGSKTEIIYAFRKIIKDKVKINEKNLISRLFTKNIPDPEILIRTGNTNRLSNFLLWQIAYTEIFFVKKLWPDFNETDFQKIINQYKKIKRNFGSI